MQSKYSRAKLVDYIVNSKLSEAELAQRVAAYLIDAGKTSDLDSVMRDAQDARAIQTGAVEVEVRSAHELDTTQVDQVTAVAKRYYPTTKTVTLNTIHDESVVGGARLSFAHASFDVTVRAKLNQLRTAIS